MYNLTHNTRHKTDTRICETNLSPKVYKSAYFAISVIVTHV